MNYSWIELETVLVIHDLQIQEHGGASGIRDLGLIESAVNKPRNLMAYSSPDLPELAASYAFGLTKNHGFLDGNKRTAYVVSRLFLRLHGWDFAVSPEQRVVFFENLGKGDYALSGVSRWFKENTQKII
ncbi:MAG: type II toxin-antitoxin system death-on-curing family toxin [Proteobacteria bacterium]|nr:type II toxin-antitoxin system death-on-curing family toxin [Pseudomonadota bacterium]MBU1387705.1 type II toxin-antitoxin system death-on-curing family toxin [Pseudomonadota bacterium]MBU1541797.1 type II toxin-antitoxin system death-on-curing family toxin [Pseudomonadota bacterium]MBU2480742.1 type II toxin-antitoxin system death-on-curing family toxin [Pseudomonadota bacterium]